MGTQTQFRDDVLDISSPSSPVATRRALFGAFTVFGVLLGAWNVSLSELKNHLDLSPGELGRAVTIGILLALPVLFMTPAAVHHWGRRLFPVAACALAGFVTLAGRLEAGWQLTLLVPFVIITQGTFNVIINAAGLHYEHVTGRHILPTLHAGFSLGGVPGTLIAGSTLDAGLPLWTIYCALGVMLLVAAYALRDLGATLEKDPDAEPRPLFDRSVVHNRAVLIVAAIAIVGVFGESTMYAWTAIYLRDELGAGVFAGSFAVACFFGAMAAGRLGSSVVQARFGRLRTLTFAGAVIAVGMSIGLSTASVTVTVIGVLITGVAFAVCVPLAYSVAGSLAPGKAAAVSGFIAPAIMIASMITPVTIGSIADATSLRVALSTEILVGLTIAVATVLFRRSPLSAPAR
jgi:hypothetical protein